MNALPRSSEAKLAPMEETQQVNEHRKDASLLEKKGYREFYGENRKVDNSNEFQEMNKNKSADNNHAKPYKSVVNDIDMQKINLQRDELKSKNSNHALNNLPPLSTTSPRSIANSNSRDRGHRLGTTQSPIPFTQNHVKHSEHAEVESGKGNSGINKISGGGGGGDHGGLDNNNSGYNKNMFVNKRVTPHMLTTTHNSKNEASLLESPISLTSSLHETHSNMKDLYSDADSMIDIGSLKSDTKEHSNTVQNSLTSHKYHNTTNDKGSKVNCFANGREQEPNHNNVFQKKLLVNNFIDNYEGKDKVGENSRSASKVTGTTFISDQSSCGTSTATCCLTETPPTAHDKSISHGSSLRKTNGDGFDYNYNNNSSRKTNCIATGSNSSSGGIVSRMYTENTENLPSKISNVNINKMESSSSVSLQPHSRGDSGLVQSTWVESTLQKSPNVRCSEPPEAMLAAASSSRSIQTSLANSGSRLSSPCYNKAMIGTPTSISSSVNRVVSTGTRTPRTREPGSSSTPRSLSFQRGNTLGSGGFGTVFQAILPDGTLAAVKELKLETNNTAAIDNEMRTMSSLPPHPNCVHYFGARYSKHHYYLIMEYISGGSIHSLRKTYGAFREPIFQSYAYMVLEGLYHLHQHGIIHRDIKGANVLLDEHGVAKIVDFGCCKDLNQGNTTLGGGGTPLWMAPEVCRGEGATMKSDVWSFGCLCLEMTNESGQPWNFPPGMNLQGIAYAIAQANKPPAIPQTLSPLAIDMISNCLKLDPMERMSVNELLNHPFFQVDFFDKECNKNGNEDEDEDDGFILSNEPSAINPRRGDNGSRVIEHEVTVNSDDTVQCNSANVVISSSVAAKNTEQERTPTNVSIWKEGAKNEGALPQQGNNTPEHISQTLVDSEEDENATIVLNKRSLKQLLQSSSSSSSSPSTSMNPKISMQSEQAPYSATNTIFSKVDDGNYHGNINNNNKNSNSTGLKNSTHQNAIRYEEAKNESNTIQNANVATNVVSGDHNINNNSHSTWSNSATLGKSNNRSNNTSANQHKNNTMINKSNSGSRSNNYNYTNSVNAQMRNDDGTTSHSGGNRVMNYQRVKINTDGSINEYYHHPQQQSSVVSVQGKLTEGELFPSSTTEYEEPATTTTTQSNEKIVDLNSTLMLNVTDDMDDNDLIEDIIQHARSTAGSTSHESRGYHSHAFHQYPLNSEASSLYNSSYDSSDSSGESSYSNTNSSTHRSSSGPNSSYSTNMSSDNENANVHPVERQVGEVVHGTAGEILHPTEHNTSASASAHDNQNSKTINKDRYESKYNKEQSREQLTREFSDSDVETPNVSQTRIGRRIVEHCNADDTPTNTQKDDVTQNSFSSTTQNNNNNYNNKSNSKNDNSNSTKVGLTQERSFTSQLVTLPLSHTLPTNTTTKNKCTTTIGNNTKSVENSASNSSHTHITTSHSHGNNREEWPTHSIIWETAGAGSVNKELSSAELVPKQFTGKRSTKKIINSTSSLSNTTSNTTNANTTTNTNTDSDTSNVLSSSSRKNSELKTAKERKPLKVITKWFKGSEGK